MKGKYFCVDKDGMVLISRKELDEALNDAYNEGYQTGKNSYYYWKPYYSTTADFTCNGIPNTANTANTAITDLDKDKITIKC